MYLNKAASVCHRVCHKLRQISSALRVLRKVPTSALGFVWDPVTAAWEGGFAALKHFREREGHCRLPQTDEESDYELGHWVSNWRSRKDDLSPERRQALCIVLLRHGLRE
jgi:hypothetical protein